jgi:diacylglycerol kinase (ATP)
MVDPAATTRQPAAIFLNNAAGSAQSASVRLAIDAVRRRLDADLHEVATRDAGELRAWLEDRLDGYRTAVIAGGDGSLSVTLNAAAGRGVTVGYLPAGFGNAAAHLLRLPRSPEGLVDVLLHGEVRPVDLVDADGRLALFAGTGWDALAARRFAESLLSGRAGWAMAIARSLPDAFRRPSVTVLADGQLVHEGPFQLLVVSTTPFYGRGLLINPGARPDSGRLVARVYSRAAPGLVAEAVRWIARRTPRTPPVDAGRIEIRAADGSLLPVQADGDMLGERTDWIFTLRPRAVPLIGNWE